MKEIEDFWMKHVKPSLKDEVDLVRVENTITSGTPDISYALRQRQGWLELKVIKSGKLFFEQFQLAWMKRRLRQCNTGLWVLATDGAKLYLFHPRLLVDCEKKSLVKDWITIKIEDVTPSLVLDLPWDWEQVKDKLAQF